METPSHDLLKSCTREYRRLKEFADTSIGGLNDEAFYRQLDPNSNSVAIIVKHLAGNIRSRWSDFLNTDGEKPWRDRDSEFCLKESDTRENLLHSWEECWKIFLDTLQNLTEVDLTKEVKIRGESHSVTEAILRQLPHYSFHVGQIVFLAKHLSGSSWKSLTIAKGESAKFNENPKVFLKP